MSTETLYFVHISDTHIGPTADYERHGHYPLPCARRVVEIINDMPQRPEFVVHTGDVVAEPVPASYRLAAETFSRLTMPIYYVVGNHDTAADIRRYLPMGPMSAAGDDPERLSFVVERKGFRFLFLDARGPNEIDPHGYLADSQLELVAREIGGREVGAQEIGDRETGPDGPPLVLFLHYPVLPMNSIWMDSNMLITNGQDLHRALSPGSSRIRGVFYGHVHQNMQTVRDGINYVSVSSVFAQFNAWPKDAITRFDHEHQPGYNFVHLLPHQTIIHQHTFPRP